MLDLGWQEFFLIAIIALVIVGPKDLPRVIRSVTRWIRKARNMARDFQNSIEDVARESELDEIKRETQKLVEEEMSDSVFDTVDPDGDIMNTVAEVRSEFDDRSSHSIVDRPQASIKRSNKNDWEDYIPSSGLDSTETETVFTPTENENGSEEEVDEGLRKAKTDLDHPVFNPTEATKKV